MEIFEKNLLLENNHVILRPLQKDDRNAFKPLTANSGLWKYFTSDLSNPAELDAWVNTALQQFKNRTRLAFTVISKTDQQIIGSTSFGNISPVDRRLEIGWTWLAPAHQGQGFNDHIKYLMLKYAFEILNFERVEFKTDVLNLPARNALKRIGAVEEGILRSHTLMTHNRRRDTIFYSILKPEWPQIKQKLKSP